MPKRVRVFVPHHNPRARADRPENNLAVKWGKRVILSHHACALLLEILGNGLGAVLFAAIAVGFADLTGLKIPGGPA